MVALSLSVLRGGALPAGADDGDGDGDEAVLLCVGKEDIAGPLCLEIESVVTELLP